MSINPVSSAASTLADAAAKPAATPKPQPQQTALPSDTVTLKSTSGGDADHDGH